MLRHFSFRSGAHSAIIAPVTIASSATSSTAVAGANRAPGAIEGTVGDASEAACGTAKGAQQKAGTMGQLIL